MDTLNDTIKRYVRGKDGIRVKVAYDYDGYYILYVAADDGRELMDNFVVIDKATSKEVAITPKQIDGFTPFLRPAWINPKDADDRMAVFFTGTQ